MSEIDGWGPHENPYEEDYEWWVHESDAYVRGHRVSIDCGCCGEEMYYDDLVDGLQFVFLCSNCSEEYTTHDGRTLTRPISCSFTPDGSPEKWGVWARGGLEADLTVKADGMVADVDVNDGRGRFFIRSETLFEEPFFTGESTDL